ncbi:hypothetical protein FPZ42_07680 [Mucilaginibacter achroorhodeus]|uniref:Uncharacterized protein n=1 Tax=Mucilaginibacter achroorhodeus TaxID=2599294 RepID=A0A563U6C2_9SPHI|nr:hypothetical protein [Mucilaginibacter achroorhodeus]TWR26906.1 hypothetical protein FPZ42_07680 [Mucilaginibacter achroorhodeus]
MASTDKALEVLQETLTSLESGLIDSTTIINSTYKEAVALANKAHKDAIALAEKTKKDSLSKFTSEKLEITKIKTAIKALTGDTSKTVKPKETKRQPKNWNDKIAAAYKELPEGSPRKDVIKKVAELFPEVDLSKDKVNLNAAIGTYNRANGIEPKK